MIGWYRRALDAAFIDSPDVPLRTRLLLFPLVLLLGGVAVCVIGLMAGCGAALALLLLLPLALLLGLRALVDRLLLSLPGTGLVVVAVVAVVFALGGCSRLEPHAARGRLLGRSAYDVLACLGPPAERDESLPRLRVWTWSYVDPGASVALGSMSALGMGVSLQEHGSCRLVLALSGGRVTAVHYSPASDGIAGRLGACAPIVADCLMFPTATPAPAGWDPDAVTPARH